jgi:CDP-diglyceride synthetase
MPLRSIRWSDLLYRTLSGALIGIAVLLIVAAFWNAVEVLIGRGDVLDALLKAVGLIVIAMAATDVGKYLFEEEVERGRELRSATEARRSLTKFMVIVCIAVALEGVVQIFRATQGPLEALFGAALLVLTSVVVMVGLGFYQKLSREVESKDSREPPPAAAPPE